MVNNKKGCGRYLSNWRFKCGEDQGLATRYCDECEKKIQIMGKSRQKITNFTSSEGSK